MTDPRYQIHVGDCLAPLRAMADATVQCCVTSPPYYGLRDYGAAGQIGLEATPQAYVAALVEVFREVRRVLRDDGTLWLNLGDSYAAGGRKTRHPGQSKPHRAFEEGGPRPADPEEIKPKDLLGIPWMVAFALRADGWYLRQDIIWHKPNPMPESVTDRCTKAHEYIFLMSKSERYHYDAAAVAEKAVGAPSGNTLRKSRPTQQSIQRGDQCGSVPWAGGDTRNRRSVWTVSAKPFKGAHFATFPPELIEPCILAGSRPWDVVLDPFGGSGTTAGVALANDRLAVVCELNPDYAALMPERVRSIGAAA